MHRGFQRRFEWSELADRRRRLAETLQGGIAILQGAGPVATFDRFRQTNELLYLAGVQTPQAYLVLDSDGRSVLYLPHQPTELPVEDRDLLAQDAELIQTVTGLDEVRPLSALPDDLRSKRLIWTPFAPPETAMTSRDVLLHAERMASLEPFGPSSSRHRQFLAALAAACPLAEVRNLTPTLDAMRLIKSPAELRVLHEAGQLSAEAVRQAMFLSRPGMNEAELEAVAFSVFRKGGAQGEGYKTIAPGGPNIWDGHYSANNQTVPAGEWVLMDCAPDLDGYTSDIGRMWPVDGQYNSWQRELYGFVVDFHEATLARIRPGVLAQQVLDEVRREMAPLHERTRWSEPAFEEATRELLTFRGTFSHPVGMAVHDVGNYWNQPLEPGMVFTIDPMIWVRDRRLYVRVEDTVAVTEAGIDVLTEGPPRSPGVVEEFLAARG